MHDVLRVDTDLAVGDCNLSQDRPSKGIALRIFPHTIHRHRRFPFFSSLRNGTFPSAVKAGRHPGSAAFQYPTLRVLRHIPIHSRNFNLVL